jgi:hypothetical protein
MASRAPQLTILHADGARLCAESGSELCRKWAARGDPSISAATACSSNHLHFLSRLHFGLSDKSSQHVLGDLEEVWIKVEIGLDLLFR